VKSISKLKKDLWKLFALRMKLERSDKSAEFVTCFTCYKHLEIGTSNCQMGHWLTKKGYPYHYFNENNCRPQCYHCNINLSGNSAVFERNLREEIGDQLVDTIYDSRNESSKRSKTWYEDRILWEKSKLKGLN